jgi:hypothetical protein
MDHNHARWLGRLEGQVAIAQERGGYCRACGGVHVPDLAMLLRRARSTAPEGPLCTCACCPPWAALAERARENRVQREACVGG